MEPNLEQLRAFVTAAEEGSFSAAARRLGRAQSAVSTAIMNLEIDLGVELFDRSGKLPVLTTTGTALLSDARHILDRGRDMVERARSLSSGIEHRVILATDEMAPPPFLNRVLGDFSRQYPRVELECLFAALGDVAELVASGRADMGLMTPLAPGAPRGLNYRLLHNLEFSAVVAPDHPLAALSLVSADDLAEHREIIPTSRGGERLGEEEVIGRTCWLAENYFIIRSIVEAGVGWAFLPTPLTRESLAARRLVELHLDFKGADIKAPLFLIWPRGRALGPAADWLRAALAGTPVGDDA
ncbi:DNA-binding transcriptional LysR family regulator [Desulfobaculum xiamenense]|uniref:DNA-binding transcriptional LysR family regulator n=1 Tax=Desulfobaculum xiamenense TaxID=995050 RepID=A0A846QLR2_9BACT|nr:LysR family transcriptional regulator [Desulfobaculum xiamenense]NJB69108.1 DNA-binding transcriptional LysR family regulator [Desulfobaculum xiamenense]